MPAAIEVVGGASTAPSSTFTPITMASGDSNTVKNQDLSKKAFLLQAWGFNQVAGSLRIRSTKMHDNVQGLRWTVLASNVFPLMTFGYPTRVYPQDPLTIENTGSAVGGQLEEACLMFYYEDLPGSSQRLASLDDIKQRGVNITTVPVSITSGSTAVWSGTAAINSSFDNFKANTDYAILGGCVDVRCCAASVRSPDFANLRVAFPGEPNIRHVTLDWFVRLSRLFSLNLIPVFNSANKATTNCEVLQNQAGAAVVQTWQIVELAAK